MATKTTIIICDKCEGDGKLYSHELVDYHRNEHVTTSKPCHVCDGTGRLKRVENVTFEKV